MERPSGPPASAEAVIARLEQAGRTLARMPASRCYPATLRSAWPEIVREPMDAYGWTAADLAPAPPDAREIDRMEEAFGWIGLIRLDRRLAGSGQLARVHGGAVRRRLVGRRSLWNLKRDAPLLSWRTIARIEHCDPKSAQSWHARGIDEIVAALREVHLAIDRARTKLQIARILGPG